MASVVKSQMSDRGLLHYTDYMKCLESLKASGLEKRADHYRGIFIGKLEESMHIFKTRHSNSWGLEHDYLPRIANWAQGSSDNNQKDRIDILFRMCREAKTTSDNYYFLLKILVLTKSPIVN